MSAKTTHTPLASTGASRRSGLQTRWGRLLEHVLPTPGPNTLVRVAQVSSSAMNLAEGSLADVGVTPAFSELRSLNGDSQYAVLVAARDAEVAASVLQGI